MAHCYLHLLHSKWSTPCQRACCQQLGPIKYHCHVKAASNSTSPRRNRYCSVLYSGGQYCFGCFCIKKEINFRGLSNVCRSLRKKLSEKEKIKYPDVKKHEGKTVRQRCKVIFLLSLSLSLSLLFSSPLFFSLLVSFFCFTLICKLIPESTI